MFSKKIILFYWQTNSAYMLFYERLSKERRDGEREDTFCEEESDEIPNVKVELTKDLADVSILMMRLCILTCN